jgi:hypothetical protein
MAAAPRPRFAFLAVREPGTPANRRSGLEPRRDPRHVARMRINIRRARSGPLLDMTPDGQFVEPPPETPSETLLRYGVVVAVVAGLVAMAALALWLALALIPVALAGGTIAYLAYRWRMWRLGGSAGGVPGPPPGGRPFGE